MRTALWPLKETDKNIFHKRVVPLGELVHVHLPLDGSAQARRGALEARAVEGVMFGYGDVSQS